MILALKATWRGTLQKWRHTNKEAQFKDAFPRLLKEIIDSVGTRGRSNRIAGFRDTGLYPFSLQAALKRLPSNSQESTPTNSLRASVDHLLALFTNALINILEKERFSKKSVTERG